MKLIDLFEASADPILLAIKAARKKFGSKKLMGGNCGMFALALGRHLSKKDIHLQVAVICYDSFEDDQDVTPVDILNADVPVYHVALVQGDRFIDGDGKVSGNHILKWIKSEYRDSSPALFVMDLNELGLDTLIRTETAWDTPAQEFEEFFNDTLQEDLRQWFKDKWVRFGPDGKIRGECARGSEGEGKPKCLPQRKAWALGKKKRATAARRKRREDPNAERKGAARMVATKESLDWDDEEQSYLHLPSVAHAKAQLSRLLQRAQQVYDNWDEQDRDTYAGGGICHIIADAICDVLSSEGIECTTVSCSHEQHVYVAGKFAEGVYTIDIPYRVYETGGGFSWQKIPDVTFEPGHVVWYRVSSNPKHFDQYTEHFESVIAEKRDACYYKVKSRYKVWPSAYASGALVQCRKRGAKNWGNKK